MTSNRIVVWIVLAAAIAAEYGCNDNNPAAPRSTPGGKNYSEKYTCNEQFGGGPPTTCPDLNVVDTIAFTATGADTYEVRDVPDSGYLMIGTLVGDVFTWTATSPHGYTEAGTWTFSVDHSSFSGSSHYVANDFSYDGDCNENGLVGAAAPADPPLPPGCP